MKEDKLQTPDAEFKRRQEEAKDQINQQDREDHRTNPRRDEFFETVYENASGDAAMVPWADLAAKQELADYLSANPGKGKCAVDVGCGLGDNAEAMAAAGYETLGFDFSPKAIGWAKQRFSDSPVEYQIGDLFNLPKEWLGAFDLVHECYTLQSIPPETLDETVPAVCSLVTKGGVLLVYTRLRDDGSEVDGPPWPLERTSAGKFSDHGMVLNTEKPFFLQKGDRQIEHVFAIWEKL
ncbi:MAG: class I SAM-dependent methyltransferase [Rhizobiaceae bacterium]|nr:class I SAM-dependent methyltransferase [Rhizobiaceae bacterium]